MKLDKVDWYEVYKKWTINSGVFEYLFKTAPFVTAKYMNNFELDLDKKYNLNEGLIKVIENNISRNKLFFIDVEADTGIKLAAFINNELKAAPILCYNFLFHPFGVVGNKELIEDLVCASKAIKPIEPLTYAFIMDSNRYIENLDIDNPMIFNNQYEITDEEVPDISILMKLGIKEACFLYKDTIKEDIASYIEFLKDNGIMVSIIDLGELLNER